MALMRRSGQHWIAENLYRAVGPDLMFPGATHFRLERGYRLADIERTNARIKSLSINAKEWAKTAGQLEALAREAEAAGHLESARDFYYRASIYYGRGQWSILADTPYKREVHARCVACYEKVCAYSDGLIERVDIPFEGRQLAAVLHLPPAADRAKTARGGRVPAVVFWPGMDMFKEEFPNVENNLFARRGLAVLSIDGPGQGETRLRGITVDDENHVRAGRAVLDYLQARPEIDPERIAVLGASFGSYWGPHLAAADRRVRAVAGIMGILYDMRAIFELAPPSFKAGFMFMSGITDEDAFDAMAARMGMRGLGERITCPSLITQGEIDLLCPLEGAERYFAELKGPKEMWIFEHESHPLGGVMAELLPRVADWLGDALAGRLPADLNRRVFYEARR